MTTRDEAMRTITRLSRQHALSNEVADALVEAFAAQAAVIRRDTLNEAIDAMIAENVGHDGAHSVVEQMRDEAGQ